MEVTVELFRELILYMRDEEKGPRVAELLAKYGRHVVLHAAITLLWWLRRYGEGLEQPLVLRERGQLDPLVSKIVAAGEFSETLEMNGNVIDFRSDMPVEKRRMIAKFVADHHRPEAQLIDG